MSVTLSFIRGRAFAFSLSSSLSSSSPLYRTYSQSMFALSMSGAQRNLLRNFHSSPLVWVFLFSFWILVRIFWRWNQRPLLKWTDSTMRWLKRWTMNQWVIQPLSFWIFLIRKKLNFSIIAFSSIFSLKKFEDHTKDAWEEIRDERCFTTIASAKSGRRRSPLRYKRELKWEERWREKDRERDNFTSNNNLLLSLSLSRFLSWLLSHFTVRLKWCQGRGRNGEKEEEMKEWNFFSLNFVLSM